MLSCVPSIRFCYSHTNKQNKRDSPTQEQTSKQADGARLKHNQTNKQHANQRRNARTHKQANKFKRASEQTNKHTPGGRGREGWGGREDGREGGVGGGGREAGRKGLPRLEARLDYNATFFQRTASSATAPPPVWLYNFKTPNGV